MDSLLVDVDAGVATLTLNNPARLNALDAESAAELAAAIADADADPGIGAIVVTGAGRGFCAGADLSVLLANAADEGGDPNAVDLEARRRAMTALYEPFLRLRSCRTPTLAAVNGVAVGAGLNLVLAADIAIAGESARFISGFLRIGIHPGGGNTSMLVDRIGPQAAAAMTLFDCEYDGTAAAEAGLVFSCVPDDELMSAASSMARRCSAQPYAATLRVKESLKTAPRTDYETQLAAETTAQLWTTTLPETAQRIAQRRNRSRDRS